jgi:uncharacterized membrane protein YedE/YeeE
VGKIANGVGASLVAEHGDFAHPTELTRGDRIMSPSDLVPAATGGALIGLSAVLLMWLTGRIAGISGIVGGVLTGQSTDKGWRLAFLGGLVAAPLLLGLIGRGPAEPQMPASWLVVVLGGLLVGFGTRLGGGCTSGHGLCGVARLSPRSIAATAIFMVTAMLVVAVTRHAG